MPLEARLHGGLHSVRRDRDATAHHDARNEFYELLLDPSMSYSCGYWEREHGTLEQAQHDKLELVCAKLGLRPGMRLLDVGCGWGSLLVHAARHHGVHATGITLSASQHEHVRARIEQHRLADSVQVRRQDHRDVDDSYDPIATVEMVEHVGDGNYPESAALSFRNLRPHGRLRLQQMSRDAKALGGGAFIESYIAADMSMVPLSATLQHLENAGLEPREVHSLREHYVRTVEAWARTLEDRAEDASRLLGPEGLRAWRLYLAGGALAFEQNTMGVHQILAVRPDPERKQWNVSRSRGERMNLLAAAAPALGVAVLVVVITFGIARLRGRYDTIDTAWGAGLAAIGAIGFTAAPTGSGGALLATALVVVWGVRLSVHMHRRGAGHGEDHRYRDMLARARSRPLMRMFFRTYLTQAGAMWFVSLPVVAAQQQSVDPGVLGIAGVVVWCVGFAFEAIGDEQLRRFTADPANAGRVLDRGLWRYTRHPNYFGDACVWWGLYLIAAPQLPGAATVLSPVFMTWLLARGTGKPMTERRMRETRSGYADYVARTSGFLPLPPKKS